MGNLSNAMQNLVGEINATTERRKAALSELHSDAQKLVKRCRQERREVVSDIKQAERIWGDRSKKDSSPSFRAKKASGGS